MFIKRDKKCDWCLFKPANTEICPKIKLGSFCFKSYCSYLASGIVFVNLKDKRTEKNTWKQVVSLIKKLHNKNRIRLMDSGLDLSKTICKESLDFELLHKDKNKIYLYRYYTIKKDGNFNCINNPMLKFKCNYTKMISILKNLTNNSY